MLIFVNILGTVVLFTVAESSPPKKVSAEISVETTNNYGFLAEMSKSFHQSLNKHAQGKINLTPRSRVLAMLVDLASMLPMLFGMYLLIQVFGDYYQQRVFTSENTKRYSWISLLYILDGLFVSPITGGLMSVALTMENPPGDRMLNISFGNNNIETLVHGLIALAVFYVMAEALKLKEEQEMVI